MEHRLPSPKPFGLPNSYRSPTPLSVTSSSSEEDLTAPGSSFLSYDIINHSPGSPSTPQKESPNVNIPKIDPSIIADLDHRARAAAESLVSVTEEFQYDLKIMSERTCDFTKLYKKCIDEAQSCVDDNVKTMYGLIAKAEELNKKMTPLYELSSQVQDIKQMLDTLETMAK